MPNSTLQIGDGDHLARKTGILTLSDFRQKHIAAGGEGAPLAGLVDRLLFTHESNDRILLNIGGIANFTLLPGGDRDQWMTTDTGPGNTLINAAMQKYFDRPYDQDGEVAATGKVYPHLLRKLKSHSYFQKPVPKTTGPEEFSLDWVRQMQESTGTLEIAPQDLVATLTRFSAETIAKAIKTISGGRLPEVYLSGGGMHNKHLAGWIEEELEGNVLRSFEEIGFNPDAKEAVCFAVLANEALSGEGFIFAPNRHPERRVNLGKVSFPV
jgi:anhydro-N-acetylmuramic acid kinase